MSTRQPMPLDPEVPVAPRVTEEEQHAARLMVCALARSADDARFLLDALGLR